MADDWRCGDRIVCVMHDARKLTQKIPSGFTGGYNDVFLIMASPHFLDSVAFEFAQIEYFRELKKLLLAKITRKFAKIVGLCVFSSMNTAIEH